MACANCGWEYDEKIDSFCSGCGVLLSGLSLADENKNHYYLYIGRDPLEIPVVNKGTYPITLSKKWETYNLQSLAITLDGSTGPPVTFQPGQTKTFHIELDKFNICQQNGKLKLFAGIMPPFEIGIICTPPP